jgi:transcriptional regulator of arginine metabolism
VPDRSTKKDRHAAILEILRTRRVRSQDELRRLLRHCGFRVTQATLSRDLRELRVAKVPRADGESYYAAADPHEASPALERLLPHLLVNVDGVGNLVVVRTLAGGAQAVAEAIDLEDWPETLGTVAGDDTILIVLRRAADRGRLLRRIRRLAGR